VVKSNTSKPLNTIALDCGLDSDHVPSGIFSIYNTFIESKCCNHFISLKDVNLIVIQQYKDNNVPLDKSLITCCVCSPLGGRGGRRQKMTENGLKTYSYFNR
jgi:hypothetical protein